MFLDICGLLRGCIYNFIVKALVFNPAGIYQVKGNNRNINEVWNMFKINNKVQQNDAGVFLVLTLNIFYTFF